MTLGKKTPLKRLWHQANVKVQAEFDLCRNCGSAWRDVPGRRLERAHVIGRQHDDKPPLRMDTFDWWPGVVNPDRIIPLCGPATDTTTCHGKQHAGKLDVLRLLTVEEQTQAVADAGGIQPAYEKLCPEANPRRLSKDRLKIPDRP